MACDLVSMGTIHRLQLSEAYSKVPASIMPVIRHQIPNLLRPAARHREELFWEERIAERLVHRVGHLAGRTTDEGDGARALGVAAGAAVLLQSSGLALQNWDHCGRGCSLTPR